MNKILKFYKFLQYAEIVVKTLIPLIEKIINKDIDGDGEIGTD